MKRFAMRMHWCALFAVVLLGFAAGCLGEEREEREDREDREDRERGSSTTSELTRTFATGSMVIPLDTTSQDAGALRAYGLVYQLLRKGVPVQWAIRQGKAAGENDVTISAPATVADLESGMAIPVPIDYRGGPFVIDAADRAAALPVIEAWRSDTTSDIVTVVHTVTGTFTADIARTLTAAPRIALLQDGFEGIAIANFNAAGIPDSTGAMWTLTSADVLSEATIAGPTTTSHVDGGLWDAAGTAKYCNLTAMHYNATARTPEVVAEVRGWLKAAPGHHAFMECQAAATFENPAAGRFLTSGGIENGASILPGPLTNRFPDDPIAQTDGMLQADDGAIHSIRLAAGSTFKSTSDVRTLINLSGTSTTSGIMLLSGHLDGVIANGRVTYLAGHDYSAATPLSTNPLTNGTKVLLNSLFETGCATAIGGQPVVRLTKTAALASDPHQITYTIDYANIGTGVANEAKITDQLPAGTTFVSATNGGSHAGGTVTWTLGNLAIGAAGSVTVTVAVTADGKYDNQAAVDFKIGITPKKVTSNTVTTTVDEDGDEDGSDDLLGISGGGCWVAGDSDGALGGGLLVLFAGFLGARRRRRRTVASQVAPALIAGVVSGVTLAAWGSGSAVAQISSRYPAERFALTGHRDGILGVEWAEVRGHLTVDLGLWFGYANDPVNIYQMADGDRVGSLVANRVGGDLVAAIRLRDRFELGIGAPVIVAQSEDLGQVMGIPTGDISGFGLGDLRLTPKMTLMRQGRLPVAVALMMGVTLPTTSTSDDYGGDDGITVSPTLAISRGLDVGLRLAAALGYRARPKTRALDLLVNDEIFVQAGLAYRLPSSLELDATFDVATGSDDVFGAFNRNHAEIRLGAAYDVTPRVQMFGALGAGVAEGFGTPDWRALLGVRIAATQERAERAERLPSPLPPRLVESCPKEPDDPDGDTKVGPEDKCPNQPEDFDGFQDADGCLDPNNDEDPIPDSEDVCRDIPGIAALRGCPELNCPKVDCPKEVVAAEKPQVKIVGGKLELLDIVYFQTGRAVIETRSSSLLDEVARVLNAHPEISKVRVEGHTDNQGDNARNKALSQRRASAVRDYLLKKDVVAGRLVAVGYGEERPKADNATEEGRTTNRRVEFTILGANGEEVR